MASNEEGSNGAVVPEEEPPKEPIYITINGATRVDANVVDKYQVGDLVISGFNNLAKSTYKEFTFQLNK